MADFVRTEAAGAAVVFEPPNQAVVNATGVVVVYSLEPELGLVQADAGGVAVVYQVALPAKRTFPVPHPQVRWQSHPNKRKFPVVI